MSPIYQKSHLLVVYYNTIFINILWLNIKLTDWVGESPRDLTVNELVFCIIHINMQIRMQADSFISDTNGFINS